MTNYPYETRFLMHMPGWPVKVSCGFFDAIEPPTPDAGPVGADIDARMLTIFDAIYKSTSVYFNFDAKPEFCTDISDTEATGELDGAGWDVLACNQLAMPTINGPDSMFYN